MPRPARDLRGQKFGRLTVIERAGSDTGRNALWVCKCDCGNEKVVAGYRMLRGTTTSCGCARKEQKHEQLYIHGMTNTRLFHIWQGMVMRCTRPQDARWPNYGGRGVSICDEWSHDFKAFYDWAISHGYKEDLSIDRINNNGNYEPDNCRWATAAEQVRNRRPSSEWKKRRNKNVESLRRK